MAGRGAGVSPAQGLLRSLTMKLARQMSEEVGPHDATKVIRRTGAEAGPMAALERLARAQATGELICVTRHGEVHLALQRGRLAWGTCTNPRFVFRRYLVEVFAVHDDVLVGLDDECYRQRRPLGEALVAKGVLTAAQVREALGAQTRVAVRTLQQYGDEKVLFLPRTGGYDSGLTFELEEVLSAPAEPAAALDFLRRPRPHGPTSWEDLADCVVHRSPHSRSTKVRDELWVVLEEGGPVNQLNATAAFLWGLADGTRTVDEITREVLLAFPMPAATAREQVVDFVREAAGQGLLILGPR